ncbi:hypothetical protein CHU95_13520 [Niveispirillum lacus]|uniref:Uncharacterized protein n=1 Tax=Niveispirillum lacus TaxID=1981099 RepID=A0A255YXM0_9PROT|nr:hypothetical protein [Niveispirillum lacus]OYQ33425.1 hypothetical protein CHU95_13520 [Niveispirillum lacus]
MRAVLPLLLALTLVPVAAGAREITEVTAEKPAWRQVPLKRAPSARELVALRIGVREDSFYGTRHILVDVPAGPAFVAQIMRDPKAPAADDGILWFDAAVPAHAFNSTRPILNLRFLMDEGCKPGEAVPPGRGPVQVTAVEAELAPIGP